MSKACGFISRFLDVMLLEVIGIVVTGNSLVCFLLIKGASCASEVKFETKHVLCVVTMLV